MSDVNWKRAGHKTHIEAMSHIANCLMENPACADDEGNLRMFMFGEWLNLKPKKKKREVVEI